MFFVFFGETRLNFKNVMQVYSISFTKKFWVLASRGLAVSPVSIFFSRSTPGNPGSSWIVDLYPSRNVRDPNFNRIIYADFICISMYERHDLKVFAVVLFQ